MRKLGQYFLLVAVVVGGSFFISPEAQAGAVAFTEISGDITTNTTWTKAGSPYLVRGSLYIPPGITLTVEPGVVVKIDGSASSFSGLDILGTINALGTSEDPIYFTSFYDDEVGTSIDDEEICLPDDSGEEVCESLDLGDPLVGDWGELYFDNTNSVLRNVFVRYSEYSITVYKSSLDIENLTVEHSETGLVVYENSTVEIAGGHLADITAGETVVIFNNSSFSAENLTVENIYPFFNDAIVLFNNSDLFLRESLFKDCPDNACVTVFDGRNYANSSSVSIENTVFEGGVGSGLLTFGSPPASVSVASSSFGSFDFFAIENYNRNLIVKAENNYWDDPSGPLHKTNPNGLGQAIYGLVDFEPWLENYPPVSCCSSVLFLPGLEASRLYLMKDGNENQLWEPNRNLDIEKLYLDQNGVPINSNVYTRDIIEEGLGVQNIYKSFVDMLGEMVNDFKITNFKLFAYDWRQSVDDIVNNGTKYEDGNKSLVDTLQSLVESSKSGKVTIVAHSNGGLLAKALLKKLQTDKETGVNNLIDSVDVLILVASPQIGTASAVPAILHGYDQKILGGLLMDETRARELGRNMPGAFGLLPSREYINRVSASPATFVDTVIPSNVTTKMVQKFGSAISSYDEYKDFLFGKEGRTNPATNQTNLPIVLSENLFSQAESLHSGIDSWTPPETLRIIEIAGWGLDTIASFEYYPQACTQSLGCGFTLDERPRFTADGDGIVIVPSAHFMSTEGNAEKYWVNLPFHNRELRRLRRNRQHKDILEVDELNNLISSVLKNESISLDNVLVDSKPLDTSNRVRLSIHSPVTLDAYDAEGNHTGKICPVSSDFCEVEENIVNSSYLEFGEGKYINLPEEELAQVKLQGTGIGTFTFESEQVLPDDTSTTSFFIDIPVTTQTKAEVTLNGSNKVPEFKLDVTGDGVMDFSITPSDNFNPVLYLQIVKATINSLDLPPAKKTAFAKKVDKIIQAIQSGKIDKAKLKAEKFKLKMEKKIAKPDPKKPRPKQISKTDAQLLLDIFNKLLDNLN